MSAQWSRTWFGKKCNFQVEIWDWTRTQICKQIGIIEESVTLNKNMLKTGVCNTLRLLKRPKCAVARTPAEWLESPNMFVFWGTVSSWVCRWRFSCLVESQFPCLVESFFDPAFFVPLGDGDPQRAHDWYNVGPPSYKIVYKPHEYYSYRYHKP